MGPLTPSAGAVSHDDVSRGRRWRDVAAVAAAIAVACCYTVGVLWRNSLTGVVFPAFDVYRADYPNLIYALRSLERGYGLLWNSLQNCGQPFLPSTLLGLPYPMHLVFLFFDLDTGIFLSVAVHMAIGGIGAYFLAREIGLGRIAALCAALAFELSGSTVAIATWVPTTILGIYVWIPTALLVCERILKAPTLAKGACLGLVLTLQLLAGYPQVLLFTYELLALRVAWELCTRRPLQWRPVLGVFAVAGILPLFLGAIQLLPMVEFMRESVRSGRLTEAEVNPIDFVTWAKFRASVAAHSDAGLGTVFAVVPAALAGIALTSHSRRRSALFFALAVALFAGLSFETPLYHLYRRLPVVSSFRMPSRFLWLAGFASVVLAAIGADRLTARHEPDGSTRLAPIVAAALGVVAISLLSATALLSWWEWALGGATVALCAFAVLRPSGRSLARLLLPVLILVNLLVLHRQTGQGLLTDARAILYAKREAFAVLGEHMTQQDRIYQVSDFSDLAMQAKSPTIFDTPSITDYEPQTSRRYAELYIRMMLDEPMQGINQFYFQTTKIPKDRRLLDLTATRYVVGDVSDAELAALGAPPLKLVWEKQRGLDAWPGYANWVRIYENPAALPRAFYVPRARVMPSGALKELTSAQHMPRREALLDAPPPDGFLGSSNPDGSGDAAIVLDRSEELVIRVTADAEGFLFVSDQYYPGWHASVNGVEMPILRGNYAFRLVRVPAGESTVVFRYRPLSVWIGTVVSAVSLLAVALYLGRAALR